MDDERLQCQLSEKKEINKSKKYQLKMLIQFHLWLFKFDIRPLNNNIIVVVLFSNVDADNQEKKKMTLN